MALKVNPKKHDALWCLGNVHTQQGFMVREASEANKFFDKANGLFQRALDEVRQFRRRPDASFALLAVTVRLASLYKRGRRCDVMVASMCWGMWALAGSQRLQMLQPVCQIIAFRPIYEGAEHFVTATNSHRFTRYSLVCGLLSQSRGLPICRSSMWPRNETVLVFRDNRLSFGQP